MSWLLWIRLEWTWGYICLCVVTFSFPLHKYPEVELLYHVVVLFLVSWGISIQFSIEAAPIYIPINNVGRVSSLPILTSTSCYLSFWWWPFWWVWGDTSLWFWHPFFRWWAVLSTLYAPEPVCLLWKKHKLLPGHWEHIQRAPRGPVGSASGLVGFATWVQWDQKSS